MQELTSKYISEVATIEKENFSFEAWSEDNITRELDNPNCIFRILLIDNVVVGYYSFYISLEEAYINNISIKKDYQGKGYSNILMKDLIDTAKSNNINNITLEVRESNLKARNLYEKFGFINYGVRPNLYKTEDGIIYWLKMEA